MTVLGHEAGHLFLAFASVPDPTDPSARPMLGFGGSHWSFVFNSEASLNEGEQITDRGQGLFAAARAGTEDRDFRVGGSAQGLVDDFGSDARGIAQGDGELDHRNYSLKLSGSEKLLKIFWTSSLSSRASIRLAILRPVSSSTFR